jgi:hypothetical protein
MSSSSSEEEGPFEPEFYARRGMSGIVVNNCFGGFTLSDWAIEQLATRGKEFVNYCISNEERMDPDLLALVQNHPDKVSGSCSSLGIDYFETKYMGCIEIDEYDGSESIKIKYDKYMLDQERVKKAQMKKKEAEFIMFLNRVAFSPESCEKKIEVLQMLFREDDNPETLQISDLVDRTSTLPGFGEKFFEAKKSFKEHSKK